MRFCYQLATPDIPISPSVTAWQGNLEEGISALCRIGYDGVEFMTVDPDALDWNRVKRLTEENLPVSLVCTGEVFGSLGLSFADPREEIRGEAIQRVCRIIDFASFLGADINIGRVRGCYRENIPKEQTEEWAISAFRQISDYAAPKNVRVALESVTAMQTNFINTVGEAALMVDRTDRENFRLMMDIFHLNIEEKDLLETIRTYSPYNVYVHLADNNRRYPGNCRLDFEGIISAFSNCGYDGTFCTEILQIPDQETAAGKSYAHLEPIFQKVYGRIGGRNR